MKDAMDMDITCKDLRQLTDEIFQHGRTTNADSFRRALLPMPRKPSDPIPFLKTRQLAGGRLSEEERDSLTAAIQTLEQSLENPAEFGKIQSAIGLQTPDAESLRLLTKQLHHRLLGLLYGILAAADFHQHSKPEPSSSLVTALNCCGQHWDAAWCYPLEGLDSAIISGNGVARIGDVDVVLNHAIEKSLLGDWQRHPTTWLTVRRLLMFLLESTPVPPALSGAQSSQLLPVLWVRR
ncbi:MAG: hypothetical protein ACKOEO_18370, partial [Planctomycetaceae bacterium]